VNFAGSELVVQVIVGVAWVFGAEVLAEGSVIVLGVLAEGSVIVLGVLAEGSVIVLGVLAEVVWSALVEVGRWILQGYL